MAVLSSTILIDQHLVLSITLHTVKTVLLAVKQVRLHDLIKLGTLNFKLSYYFYLKVVNHALHLLLHPCKSLIDDVFQKRFVQVCITEVCPYF